VPAGTLALGVGRPPVPQVFFEGACSMFM
jgi:hypothetical protein